MQDLEDKVTKPLFREGGQEDKMFKEKKDDTRE